MKILEFVTTYKKCESDYLKENYVKDTLDIKNYISIIEKINLMKRVVIATTYEKNSEGKNTGNVHVDSVSRYLLFTLSVIDAYTNLEVDFINIIEEYDLLAKENLIRVIFEKIPENELAEIQTILDMQFNDAIQNNLSIHGFIQNQLGRFVELGSNLKPMLGKLIDTVNNLDDEKAEKISGIIEKALSRIK
jgi:hypothetical protein